MTPSHFVWFQGELKHTSPDNYWLTNDDSSGQPQFNSTFAEKLSPRGCNPKENFAIVIHGLLGIKTKENIYRKYLLNPKVGWRAGKRNGFKTSLATSRFIEEAASSSWIIPITQSTPTTSYWCRNLKTSQTFSWDLCTNLTTKVSTLTKDTCLGSPLAPIWRSTQLSDLARKSSRKLTVKLWPGFRLFFRKD